MSQRGLEALLRPKSIAVIGASVKPGRAGYIMLRNLLAGGFSGPVLPVTPKYKAVSGVLAWPTIASLPFAPDLAVICTHARRNLALLQQLGEKGCKACIILSAPASQQAELKACASRWQIRLLGPNSLGLLAPWQGLNASFSPVPIGKGRIAFISQSAIPFWTGRNSVTWDSHGLSLWATAWIPTLTICSIFLRATVKPAPFCFILNISAMRVASSRLHAARRVTNPFW